ncbi:MAG: hypothetical protein IKF70_04955 [Firmicutes bacterium]|nr:hypothetical protein [Bacillota bacterium]
MNKHVDADALLAALYDADAISARGAKIIREFPEVEAREPGEWTWSPNGMDWGIGAWVCSRCGSRPETWWNTVKECHPLRCSGSHYCGNCGAKMKGEFDT